MKAFPIRLTICWTLLFGYVCYFFAMALLKHIVRTDYWQTVVERWMLYSLTGAAMAMSVWIALGDGNWLLRLVFGLLALVWVWIIWQGANYVAFYDRQENPGSTTEGFSYYVVGQSFYALAIGIFALTAVRWVFGVRLIRPGEFGPLISQRLRFTLAELFVLVAIFAITLVAVKAIAPLDTTYLGWFASKTDNFAFLFNWICATAIVLPTAIAVSFYPRWALAAVFYFTAAIVVVVAIPRWSGLSRMPLHSWRFFIGHEWLFYSMLLSQPISFLVVLRWLGYRFCVANKLIPFARNQQRLD